MSVRRRGTGPRSVSCSGPQRRSPRRFFASGRAATAMPSERARRVGLARVAASGRAVQLRIRPTAQSWSRRPRVPRTREAADEVEAFGSTARWSSGTVQAVATNVSLVRECSARREGGAGDSVVEPYVETEGGVSARDAFVKTGASRRRHRDRQGDDRDAGHSPRAGNGLITRAPRSDVCTGRRR